MAIIDITRMATEIRSTMLSNFSGTIEERFQKSKRLYLETIEEYIEENKQDIINELEKEKI